MDWQPMETAPRDGSEFVWLQRIIVIAAGKPNTHEHEVLMMRRVWSADSLGRAREGDGFWMARWRGSVSDYEAKHGWWAPPPPNGVPASGHQTKPQE